MRMHRTNDTDPERRPRRRPPVWFLVVAIALLIPGLWWGLPGEFSVAYDAPGPYGPLAFAARYTEAAISAVYPAVHQLVLLVAYAFSLLGLALAGNLDVGSLSAAWPHGFRDPVGAFSALILVGRAISVAMAVGILASLWRIRFREWTRGGALAGALLLLGSGVFVYYARVTNVDLPYVFWWTCAFVALWRYVVEEDGRRRDLVVAGIFFALAAGSKTQAAGLIVGAGLVVIAFGRRSSTLPERLRDIGILVGVSAAAYLFVAVLPQPARWLYHVENFTLGNRALAYAQDAAEDAHSARESILAMMLLAGLGLAALGAAFLVRARRWRELALLVVPPVVYYCVIILPTSFAPPRFMLPLGLPLAVLAGVAVGRVAALVGPRRRVAWAFVVALVIGVHFVTGYAPVTWAQSYRNHARLARELPRYVPPGSAVLWIGDVVRMPPPDVYRDYRLMLRPGDGIASSATEHAFAPYESDVGYALAALPSEVDVDAVPLTSWEHPSWVRKLTKLRALREFHLYRIVPRAEPASTEPAPPERADDAR